MRLSEENKQLEKPNNIYEDKYAVSADVAIKHSRISNRDVLVLLLDV